MMTTWNGNIFRDTGPLWGDSTGHRCFVPRHLQHLDHIYPYINQSNITDRHAHQFTGNSTVCSKAKPNSQAQPVSQSGLPEKSDGLASIRRQTSHYPNECWLILVTCICVTRPHCVKSGEVNILILHQPTKTRWLRKDRQKSKSPYSCCQLWLTYMRAMALRVPKRCNLITGGGKMLWLSNTSCEKRNIIVVVNWHWSLSIISVGVISLALGSDA